MDKLHTILYDSSLAIVEQDTSTIEGYSSLQNYYRAIAPFNTEYIPYVIFYPTNTADDVGVPAEYMLMELIEPTTIDGSTYYAYETGFPPAVTGSARATKIDVTIAFIVKDEYLIGVSRYDEDAAGYNDTTYIAAQLLIDYPSATTDQYVRVFNTETDWVFNGTIWTDTDDITITDLKEYRSDTASYTLRKGTSTSRPTHAPNNTESIIAILNTKISSSEAYANFYTKTDSDNRFVNITGDTMTANLTLPSMTLYNVNGNAIFTMDDEGVVRVAQGGISHELGENLFVRGDEVGTILNGDAIMYDGSIGASGKMNVVTITSANIATLIANPHFFLGVATQAFSGIQNRLNWYGGVSDLNTIAYTSNVTYPAGEGKEIYVDMVNGGLTYIRPAKPLPVVRVGVVVTYHATQGRILVRPTFSTALKELHDVDFNGYTFIGGETILYNLASASWQVFDLAGALLGIENDKADKATTYTKTEVDNLVSSLYRYKGVVATYADLQPKEATAVIGDVWNVTNDENTGGTGVNYAWTGSAWDDIGVVDKAVLSRTAQQTIVVALTKGTLGKYYATVAGFSLILNNEFTLLFPDATTDLTENVSVSFNGVSGTYKNLKYDDTLNNVIVRHTLNAKVTAYYDNTELLMKGQPLIDLPFTFDSSINSIYGNGKPINGSPYIDVIKGLSLYPVAYQQNVVDTGTINFDSVSSIDYYDWLNSVIIAGTGSNIVVTNNTGATADMMVVVISNTPIASKIASELAGIIPTYFEGYTYIVNPELQSIGVNLLDKTAVTIGFFVKEAGSLGANILYDAIFIKIKEGKTYTITGDLSTNTFWFADLNSSSLGLFTSTSGVAPSNANYVGITVEHASLEIAQLEEGSSATTFVAYNSPQDNFKLTANGLSVGTSVRDLIYEDNGVWWKKKYVGYDYNDVLKDTTGYTNDLPLTNTSRFYVDLTSVLGYKLASSDSAIPNLLVIIGNTTFTTVSRNTITNDDVENYFAIDDVNNLVFFRVNKTTYPSVASWEAYLLANDVTFVYELEDMVTTAIEQDGSLIQESNTTLVQLNNFATEYEITFAMNMRKLVDTLNKKVIAIRTEMETIRWTDLRTPMTQAIQGNTQKPDFDYTNIGLLFPQNDATEIVYTSFQFPHSYVEGSNIRPHIHMGQALDLQAVFKIEYKWVNIGDALPTSWATLTLDQYATEYVSGTLHQILYSSAEIDGTGKKISSILKCKLYRDDNVYTGDILVSDFDVHYQEDSNGSRQEYVK